MGELSIMSNRKPILMGAAVVVGIAAIVTVVLIVTILVAGSQHNEASTRCGDGSMAVH